MDLEKTLAAAPLLHDLDAKIIKRLAEQGVRRTYPAGEWIIRQDSPASALYVILRGRARAQKDGEQDRTPTEMDPGDVVGRRARSRGDDARPHPPPPALPAPRGGFLLREGTPPPSRATWGAAKLFP